MLEAMTVSGGEKSCLEILRVPFVGSPTRLRSNFLMLLSTQPWRISFGRPMVGGDGSFELEDISDRRDF